VNRSDSLQELERLRRRLASSENVETLRRIAQQTDELRWVSPESTLATIADFFDRVSDKLDRLTPISTKVVASK
jgi:hypothetical protein